jgi:hypothetical protein
MKGYKAFDKNLKCLGFQFKVGKTFETKEIELCKSGFHFCENPFDVYNYYPKETNTRICEVEALGEVKKEGDKSVTNKIKIVKELSDIERLDLWIKRTNSGDWNSGYGNSGNRNSGDWNSGYGNSGNKNSGNRNSGDWNSGYGNSGNKNSGDKNSGNGNSGDWNSGYGNSGNRNSGDWNSGDGNSGYFNTFVPVYFFNKPSTLIYTKEFENKIRSLNVKPILQYIYSDQMTEEEKTNNPYHKVTGGFLRKTNRMNWTQLTQQDKEFIKSLPNFDDTIFKQISGISLIEEDTIEIVVNGITKTIKKKDAIALGLIKE